MKSRNQGFIFCWVLVLAITTLFSHTSQGQPQTYFKGSQITQLPSKALPRIGRRSGVEEMTNSESSEIPYSYQIPASDSYPPEVYREMVDQENLFGPNPNFIFLLKRFMGIKDKVLRNEKPIGIFRNRNEK